MKKYTSIITGAFLGLIAIFGLIAGMSIGKAVDAMNQSSATKVTTEWAGCPMVSDNDPYTPNSGWLPAVEIGLRSDGIIVWRTNTSSHPRK